MGNGKGPLVALAQKREQCQRVTRSSDGAEFKVKQRVSFVDPKSKMYVDGYVAGIRGASRVEVGYRDSAWSDAKYNQVVSLDALLCVDAGKAAASAVATRRSARKKRKRGNT
jgi:hypothetical protein